MFGLGQLPRSAEAALRDIRSDRVAVRMSAAADLGRHGEGDHRVAAVRALLAALEGDASSKVRAAAAMALADAGAEGAAGALLGALSDAHPEVRHMALLALGEVGQGDDRSVVEAITGALEDPLPSMRFQALLAAHRLGIAGSEAALIRAVSDADGAVRHIALRLLEERALSEEGGARGNGPAVAEAALAALADPVPGVRLGAALVLARLGRNEGHEVVAAVVRRADAGIDPEDEQAAVVLAGEIPIERARAGLARRAFGGALAGRFQYEARVALARMNDPRAREAIRRGLHAWTRDARTLAVVAAGRGQVAEARPVLEAMLADPSRAEPDAVEEALRLLELSRERGA